MDNLTAKKLAEAGRMIAEVLEKEPGMRSVLIRSYNGKIEIQNVSEESIDGLPPGDVVFTPSDMADFLPFRASVFRDGVEFYLYLHEKNAWPAYLNFNA